MVANVPAPKTSNDSGAQRVTLAVVVTKLDFAIERIAELIQRFDAQSTRIEQLEKQAIVAESEIADVSRRLGRAVQWVSYVLAGIAVGLVVAGVAFAFGWKP